MRVSVQSYSGYKADERPEAILFDERTVRILDILGRWYEPGAEYFKVKADDLYIYILKHELGQDMWTIEYMEKTLQP